MFYYTENYRFFLISSLHMTNAWKKIFFLTAIFFSVHVFAGEILPIANEWKLPLSISPRKGLNALYRLKNAGFLDKRFGHLHTGIDLINPRGGPGEKVYAAASGRIVSIYAKEPHLSVMIRHRLPSKETIWTVYVHVTKVKVKVGDLVSNDTIIAHLMDKSQLNKYGWEFNHLHFEVLKYPRMSEAGQYLSFSARCKTKKEVEEHFYNPVTFLQKMWATGY